jgi:hypothetical protein
VVFTAAGLGVFQGVAARLFPAPPGGGLNLERVLRAGVVGGACAAVGAGVGKLVESLRK